MKFKFEHYHANPVGFVFSDATQPEFVNHKKLSFVSLADSSSSLEFFGSGFSKDENGSISPAGKVSKIKIHILDYHVATIADLNLDLVDFKDALGDLQTFGISRAFYEMLSQDRLIIDMSGSSAAYGTTTSHWMPVFQFLDGNFTFKGHSEADVITLGDGENILRGGGGDDRLVSGSGDDRISGGAGDDGLTGGYGNDRLFGGSGSDSLAGGDGDDSLFGGGKGDTLQGEGGADRMAGGSGNDTLFGGEGVDSIAGGTGADEILGDAGGDEIDGGAGGDRLSGGDGDDSIFGGSGNDKLFGQADNDLLKGGGGRDEIHAGEGNDILSGEAGSDRLFGEQGNDFILGGAGGDRLSGGAGNDTFIYAATSDSRKQKSADLIEDFHSGADFIDLSLLELSISFNAAQKFTGTGAEILLRQGENADLTWVAIDATGDGKAEMWIEVNHGGSGLVEADFIF